MIHFYNSLFSLETESRTSFGNILDQNLPCSLVHSSKDVIRAQKGLHQSPQGKSNFAQRWPYGLFLCHLCWEIITFYNSSKECQSWSWSGFYNTLTTHTSKLGLHASGNIILNTTWIQFLIWQMFTVCLQHSSLLRVESFSWKIQTLSNEFLNYVWATDHRENTRVLDY